MTNKRDSDMTNSEIPKWVQNKMNKLEQKKLIVRPDVAKNIQLEIDRLKHRYTNKKKIIEISHH